MNTEKLKQLTKVDFSNTQSVNEFHKDFQSLTEEEQMTLILHFCDKCDDESNDDSTITKFLRDERFKDINMKVLDLFKEEDKKDFVDKLNENITLLEDPKTEEDTKESIN